MLKCTGAETERRRIARKLRRRPLTPEQREAQRRAQARYRVRKEVLTMAKQTRQITAVIDTREQRPLRLAEHGLATVIGGLQHGDYSLIYPDLRRAVAIERKSLDDFVQCCKDGKAGDSNRERFTRELAALRGYRYRAVVIEADMAHIMGHAYRSEMAVNSVMASIARWTLDYQVPIIFCGDAQGAARYVARALLLIARDVIDYARSACPEPAAEAVTV